MSRWVRDVLDAIRGSGRLELVLVDAPRPAPTAGQRWPHAAYEWLDRRVFGRRDDALAPADASDLLGLQAGAVGLEPGELDVVLDLRGDSGGELDGGARYGRWVVRLGERSHRNGPPYFWEISHGQPVSEVGLEMLPEGGDGGHILYRAVWATDRLSPHRNRVAACWRVADAVLGRLLGLQEHGPGYLAALPTYDDRPPGAAARYREPSVPELVGYLTGLVAGLVRRKAAIMCGTIRGTRVPRK